ncbi:mechanosensitive ion channel domain-containing protein [uncultured Porphyromonas sp.]|uniref:mechanosensitive ion channel family protein n=1 Tax=uncultured Porphyromonas sp. TaxID=159274 RepID=UPI00261366C1|nr:mechanosensitive ion channel domain-containing protein [uncultured Porphyromonas sp.]
MFLLADILPVDSAQTSGVRNALGSATQPLNLDYQHWFGRDHLESWINGAINFGVRVLLVLVLFWLGRIVIRWVGRLFDKFLRRRAFDGVAVTLLDSLFTALLYVTLGIILASILGVKSVSFAAVLASMGLAVGMALSGQLQNMAGGVIIMVTKPFGIGDFISAQGIDGTVRAVRLFHTEVLTPDNKAVFIPNGILSSNLVTNFSHEDLRRVEWTIGIEYDEDFQRVRQVILDLLAQDERIRTTPEPVVVLHNLNSSSVDILVRAWVASGDLWNVFWNFNERVYADFNAKGIGFPFPQLTIHQGK